jgi:hypothetical protein
MLADDVFDRMQTADGKPPATGPEALAQNTNRYPNSPCKKSGHLAVHGNSQHRIYWEECGSANGEPVMFMRGGPGAGCFRSRAGRKE